MPRRRPIIGLALGGGGARAGVHVGVLKAFEAQKIPIDIIAGTSAGALIGGMYAAKRSADFIEKKILEYTESDLLKRTKFNFLTQVHEKEKNDLNVWEKLAGFIKKEYFLAMSLTKQSIISSQDFMENIAFFIEEVNIENLKLPFAALTTDLEKGEEVVLQKGPLKEAVYASSAIPGMVPPLQLEDKFLFEGGIVNMIPVSVVKDMGAELIIAVDISKLVTRQVAIKNCLDAVVRANAIMSWKLNQLRLRFADVVISSSNLDIYWADFTKTKELIKLGEQGASIRMDEIKKKMELPLKRRLLSLTKIFQKG